MTSGLDRLLLFLRLDSENFPIRPTRELHTTLLASTSATFHFSIPFVQCRSAWEHSEPVTTIYDIQILFTDGHGDSLNTLKDLPLVSRPSHTKATLNRMTNHGMHILTAMANENLDLAGFTANTPFAFPGRICATSYAAVGSRCCAMAVA